MVHTGVLDLFIRKSTQLPGKVWSSDLTPNFRPRAESCPKFFTFSTPKSAERTILNLSQEIRHNRPTKAQGYLLCSKVQGAGPSGSPAGIFSTHSHCSRVVSGRLFGKRLGCGKARKPRHLPFDKSNICMGVETGMLCPLPSCPGASRRVAPYPSSPQSLERPA